MALPRDFRGFTTAGETPATIAADSANIGLLYDNVDTGNPNRESLFGNLDELVDVLNILNPQGATTELKEYEFTSSNVKRMSHQFSGNIEITEDRFSTSEITDYNIRTRPDAGTFTDRADLTALNAYLATLLSTDIVYIENFVPASNFVVETKASITFAYQDLP